MQPREWNVTRTFVIVIVTMIAAAGLVSLQEPHPPHVRPADDGGVSTGSPGSDLSGITSVEPVIRAVRLVQHRAFVAFQASLDAQIATKKAQVAALEQQGEQLNQAAEVVESEASAPDYSTSSHVPDPDATMACIRAHESDTSGGYSAQNPTSTASGAYQVLDTTWDGYAGYERAIDAPPEVQDQWTREALASQGTQPWAGSGC